MARKSGVKKDNKPAEALELRFPEDITPATLAQAVEFIDRAKELAKRGEDMLKVYVTQAGEGDEYKTVELADGRRYGFYPKPRRSIEDVERAVLSLMQGVRQGTLDKGEIWKALTLAPAKGEKLAGKAGIDLDGLVIEKITKTFGVVESETGGNL